MHCNSQLVMSYCWSISLKWLHQYIDWLHTFSQKNGFSSSQSQLLSNAVTSEKGVTLPTAISWRSPFTQLLLLLYSPGAWCATHGSGADIPAEKIKYIQLLCFQTWICCLENCRLIERHFTVTWVQLWSETLLSRQHGTGKYEGSHTVENKTSPPFLLNRNNSEYTIQDSQWLIHCRNCSRELHFGAWENTTPVILLQTASSWFILVLECKHYLLHPPGWWPHITCLVFCLFICLVSWLVVFQMHLIPFDIPDLELYLGIPELLQHSKRVERAPVL